MFKFTTLKYKSVISHLLGQEVDSQGVFGGVCPQFNLSQNLQDRTGDETLQLQCFMLKDFEMNFSIFSFDVSSSAHST